MNPNCARNEFLDDLLGLYCKTKVAAIESLLIKVAASDNRDFNVWLLNNKKLRTLVSNPLIYDAFALMIDLRRRYPKGMQRNDMAKELLYTPGPAQSTLGSFDDCKEDPEVKAMLTPYTDILVAANDLLQGAGKVDALGDLKFIKQQYDNEKDAALRVENKELTKPKKTLSVINQRREMFKSLLSMFESDVASAFEQSGLPEKAEQIRGGTLAKPLEVGVKVVVGDQKLSYQQGFVATIMVDRCWKNYDPRWTNYNHSLVQLTFLSKADVMTSEDYFAIQQEHAAKTNVADFLSDESEEPYPHIDSGERVKFSQQINPSYLYMLAKFFAELKVKLKIP